MALLSPKINASFIRWKEHQVGRVLEVRFVHRGSPFALMAVYQHVWSTAKTSHQNRKDRAALLSALGKAAKQFSAITSLVLAGDFNSSLEPCNCLVGPRTCSDSRRPDSEGSQKFVRNHHLVALNTWHTAHPHTFQQGKIKSQIDFILTKEIASGSQAKQSAPIKQWELGSWKVGGHWPLQARIRPIGHWSLGKKSTPLNYDSKKLQEAVRENTEKAATVKAWVASQMLASHPDTCNDILLQALARFFPKEQRPKPIRPTLPSSRRMWELARELKALNHTALNPKRRTLHH